MADSKLTNQRKNAAASVLQHTWFIHRYQRRSAVKGDEIRLRQHQRKFLAAIGDFRRIKWEQRKLQERGNSLLDVGKVRDESCGHQLDGKFCSCTTKCTKLCGKWSVEQKMPIRTKSAIFSIDLKINLLLNSTRSRSESSSFKPPSSHNRRTRCRRHQQPAVARRAQIRRAR